MTALLLLPGEIVCGLVGLERDSDHKQILRTFINTLVWGTVGVAAVLTVGL